MLVIYLIGFGSLSRNCYCSCRWFPEEVKYFEYVFDLFKEGLLKHVESGVTFRELMAAVLQVSCSFSFLTVDVRFMMLSVSITNCDSS